MVLFHIRYMDAAVKTVRADGFHVRGTDFARLSSFVHDHVNMRGRYSFALPELPDDLRPLPELIGHIHRDHEHGAGTSPMCGHVFCGVCDTRLVVAVGRPVTGNRNDCKAWGLPGAVRVIGDGGYRGTGVLVLHRRERGQDELPDWKNEHNASHRHVRARVEHVFARMKHWKILRDCRLKGDGVHHAPCSASPACTTSSSPGNPRTGYNLRHCKIIYGTALGSNTSRSSCRRPAPGPAEHRIRRTSRAS